MKAVFLKSRNRKEDITLKSEQDIAGIAAAGKVVSHVLETMAAAVAPGVTTMHLDAMARRLTAEAGAEAAFLGYRGFPGAICASVNEQVIHGIPNSIPLREGDVVGLDYGARLNGWYADSALSVPVGAVSPDVQRLLRVTEEALWVGVKLVKPGATLGDIGGAVQRHCERAGFSVVRDMVGHGIGRDLHEYPDVPNYGRPGKGIRLRKGMTFCIEPMINAGGADVRTLADDWTIVAEDGRASAHFEHTVAVTATGVKVLTLRSGQTAPAG
jgi:methionyl aminopeptidase